MKSHNYNNPTGTDSEGPYWLNPETGEKLRWNGPMVGESKTYQSTIQTAMQELIEWLEQNEIYYNKELILKLKQTLEKEKEQIMAAKNDPTLKSPLEYYNQTYNQTNVGNDGFEFDNSSTIPPPKTNNL